MRVGARTADSSCVNFLAFIVSKRTSPLLIFEAASWMSCVPLGRATLWGGARSADMTAGGVWTLWHLFLPHAVPVSKVFEPAA